jgi:type II secretory ATPase GspE/PulE/Tfp pilus assembly ATPase PilB-like protein
MYAMQVDEGQLRDFLVDSGLMTRGQLADIAGSEDDSLYSILARRNIIEEDALRRAAAHATGTAFVVLAKKEDISPTALLYIPEPISRTHNMLAYRLEGGVLEVALLDLDDLAQLKPLNLPFRVRPRLTSRNSIKHGLLYYQKILRERFGSLLQQGTQAVDALIHHALLSSAHGVHIDISTTALVRYRIGTMLREAMQLPLHVALQLSERLKMLAKLLPTSTSLQEGRFKFEKEGETHIVHVSALPTANGERMVLRLARESAGTSGFALTSLGFHGATLEQAQALLREPAGLIIVAGPEGGGKTTTLYTLLDQLDHHDLSIATIEERIEHRFPHVAQTHIRPELGLTTVAGLRAILRQDPDVVMIGAIRDADTLALAAHAASRGVLVLAGIEAASASAALDSLRSLGVSPLLLASSLRGVIGVDVVKKLCPYDKEMYLLSRAEGAPLEPYATFGRVLETLKNEKLVDDDKQWKEILFARAVSCSQCEGGYKGATGVQEIISISSQIKEMLLGGASGSQIEEEARGEGALTMAEDALYKATLGQTSVEEVFRLVERYL